MKLAIMQPYIFPYLGYFQLIHACDTFISLNDVNFIKQGWINRNQVLINRKPSYFTVPLLQASSNKPINETRIHQDLYPKWKKGFMKSISQSYAKSPNFESIYESLGLVLNNNHEFIDELAMDSIKMSLRHLSIERELIDSTSVAKNGNLRGVDRVMHVCKNFGATDYVNLPGGKELYSKERFENEGIRLHFIQSGQMKYMQNTQEFHPNLSILDLLFNCTKEQLSNALTNYQLV